MDEHSQAIDLAKEPDFELGTVRVIPSTCRIQDGETDHRLEARVMAVLVALARAAPGTVTRDELVAACWGGRAVTDDAIARAIAKLRALARSHTPPFFAIETVTKIGFRLVTSVQTEAAPVPAESLPPPARSWKSWILPAAAVVLVSIFLAVSFSPRSSQPVHLAIATLELRDPGLERLSGLVRDNLVQVATGYGVSVSDASTSDGRGEFTLDGALHYDSGAPVVTLRLSQRNSDLTLWSGTFAGDENGEAALADVTATRTMAVFECAISERRRESRQIRSTTLPLYFNVCDAAVGGDYQRTTDSARILVRAAPNHATARAFLANALALQSMTTQTPAQTHALQSQALEEAERALAIDRQQPRAYLALARASQDPDVWSYRERMIQRAMEIDPTFIAARNANVEFLRRVGRWRDALRASEYMDAGTPPRLGAVPLLALLQGSQGNVRGAYQTIDRLERVRPGETSQLRWTILVWWDALPRARQLNRTWGERLPESSVACFDQIFAALTANNRNDLPSACSQFPDDWKVRMLARLGNIDAAFGLLNAAEQREQRSTITFFYPEMRVVRADQRFVEIVRRHGLLDYWRSTSRAPDFCAEEHSAPICEALRQ